MGNCLWPPASSALGPGAQGICVTCPLPHAPLLGPHFPAWERGLEGPGGRGWKEGLWMGGGLGLTLTEASSRTFYVSPNVMLRDREHQSHHSCTLPGTQNESVFLRNFVIIL